MEKFFESISGFDNPVLEWIHDNCSNTFLDTVLPIGSLIMGIVIWAAAAAVMLIFRKTRVNGIAMAVACTLTFLLGHIILKHAIMRDRPPMVLELAPDTVIAEGHGSSFPSSHAAIAFCGAAVMLFFNKKLAIVGYVLALCTAFSRLYLFAHFPSDVIAGAVLGTVIAVVSCIITRKVSERITGDDGKW